VEIELQMIWVEGDPLPEVGEGAPVQLLDNDPDFVDEFHTECKRRVETFLGASFTERHIILEIDDTDLFAAFAVAPKIPATVLGARMLAEVPTSPLEALEL
jgi:hypothetical protein